MQDNISTLPTTNDTANPSDIDTINSMFVVHKQSNTSDISKFVYIAIIYFIISSSPVEDFLTTYVECTCNSPFLLNVAKAILFCICIYVLFTYLIK